MTHPKATSDPKQLAKDIRDLAQSLLDDPVTSEIIRKAGAHMNFTPDDETVVYEFAVSREFLRCFEQEKSPAFTGKYKKYLYGLNNWKIRANIDVAIGVARRVAEGEFVSVGDLQAKEQIEDNMVPVGMHYDVPNARQISFEDFHRILIEYMQLPELPDLLKEWSRASCEEDSAYEQWQDADAPAIKIMRRYGLVRGATFAHIAQHILEKKIDYCDANIIRKLVRRYNKNHTLIRGIKND